MPQLHYAIESVDGFSEPELVPVCGNDFRRTKKLTEDWREVTCPTCRKLSGFDEQLTEVHGDPLLDAERQEAA